MHGKCACLACIELNSENPCHTLVVKGEQRTRVNGQAAYHSPNITKTAANTVYCLIVDVPIRLQGRSSHVPSAVKEPG